MAVIAIDWDNTLMEGKEWLPGAKDAILKLREKGHKIVIHSCNNPQWIEKNMNEAGIPIDYIWGIDKECHGKPMCDLYIDDKGFHFTDWKSDLDNIFERLEGKDNRKWSKY